MKFFTTITAILPLLVVARPLGDLELSGIGLVRRGGHLDGPPNPWSNGGARYPPQGRGPVPPILAYRPDHGSDQTYAHRVPGRSSELIGSLYPKSQAIRPEGFVPYGYSGTESTVSDSSESGSPTEQETPRPAHPRVSYRYLGDGKGISSHYKQGPPPSSGSSDDGVRNGITPYDYLPDYPSPVSDSSGSGSSTVQGTPRSADPGTSYPGFKHRTALMEHYYRKQRLHDDHPDGPESPITYGKKLFLPHGQILPPTVARTGSTTFLDLDSSEEATPRQKTAAGLSYDYEQIRLKKPILKYPDRLEGFGPLIGFEKGTVPELPKPRLPIKGVKFNLPEGEGEPKATLYTPERPPTPLLMPKPRPKPRRDSTI